MIGVFWLASYPKAGNTWLRTFLSNYWSDAAQPVSINELVHTGVVAARQIFDDLLSMDSAELTAPELDEVRPQVYRALARECQRDQRIFWKIHDAFQRLPNGEPIFPLDTTSGVIYVVRSPLDLVISYAHHNGISIDESIAWMNDPIHGLFLPASTRLAQVPQVMGTYSGHVSGWVDQNDLPLLAVRYEDMTRTPLETFGQVARFVHERLTLPDPDPERIARAVRFSSFAELKRQEGEHGFVEKNERAALFFRKGQVGDWRESLNPDQVGQLIDAHRDVMIRFGYLDTAEHIVDG